MIAEAKGYLSSLGPKAISTVDTTRHYIQTALQLLQAYARALGHPKTFVASMFPRRVVQIVFGMLGFMHPRIIPYHFFILEFYGFSDKK